MNCKLFFGSIMLVLAVLLSSTSVFAQDLQPTPSDDDVNNIARQLYCPGYENIRLDLCNTDTCKKWREEIREQLTAGKSKEEILSYFTNQYDSYVLADPAQERWLFNASPILIFFSGLLVIIWVYRTRKVNLPLPEPQRNFDDDIKGGNQL